MTMLEKLRTQKATLEATMEESGLTLEQLWMYQELNYRIEVFESCQMFYRSAPCVPDTKILSQHYKLVDTYVQHLSRERQYGKPADDTQKQHRAAALENLNQVIEDYRRRFKSFPTDTVEHYPVAIGHVLHNVLIAWTQHRQCYVEFNKEV